MEIVRKAVQSSNITSAGYDSAEKILEVEFRDGSVYQYHNVPSEVHKAFVDAPSPGRYLANAIKPIYRCERMT